MIRLSLLFFLCSVLPVLSFSRSTVTLHYRWAVPEDIRFYSRSPIPLKSGYRCEYDTAFRLLRVRRFDKGRETGEWRYLYAPTGLLKGCDRYSRGVRKEGWRYTLSGKIHWRHLFMGRGRYNRSFRSFEYFYGAAGVLRSIRVRYSGKVLKTIQFLYHPTGELFARAEYSITGALMERTVFRTTDSGRLREALLYRWGRLAAVYVYRYSQEGCPLGRVQRKRLSGDPLKDPLQERVKPLKGPG